VVRRWKLSTVKPIKVASETLTSTSTVKRIDSSIPIGATFLAGTAAALATISATAATVEHNTARTCLPFSANGQRYDQDQFAGCFCHMLLACDPRLLFYSETEVRQAQTLVQTASEYAKDPSMECTLWEARRISEVALLLTREISRHNLFV
jgi:pantoate kinase